MAYVAQYDIWCPDGYDFETIEKIAIEAQRLLEAEHVRMFGNFSGPEISRDMVRWILIEAERLTR